VCGHPEVGSDSVPDPYLLQTFQLERRSVWRSVLRTAAGAFVLVAVAVAEVTCLNLVTIARIKPDIVLVVLVCLAAERGVAGSFGWAVAGGLLQDVLGTGVLGINVFSKTLVCLAVSYAGTRVVTDRPAVTVTLVFVATVMDRAVRYSLLAVAGLHYGIVFYLLSIMVPCAFYNSLVTPVIGMSANRYIRWADRWASREQV